MRWMTWRAAVAAVSARDLLLNVPKRVAVSDAAKDRLVKLGVIREYVAVFSHERRRRGRP